MSELAVKQFSKGDIIFKEGQFQTFMYDIKSGNVGIYSKQGTPGEVKLTELSAGQYFGEMGVIEAYPRSATAVAESDCELLEITAEQLSDYFKNSPDVILDIYKNLAGRLKALTEDYTNVCKDITEYVKLEEKNCPSKPSLWARIKKIIADSESMASQDMFVDSTGNIIYLNK